MKVKGKYPRKKNVCVFFNGVTTNGAISEEFIVTDNRPSTQSWGVTTSGVGSYGITFEGTNDPAYGWYPYLSYGGSLDTNPSTGAAADWIMPIKFKYLRARITALSGTGAKVYASMCM